jgi:DNA-directed RNA polymerase specialized sigma subunit
LGTFEAWLLLRVAQAVESGEVPAALLTELQAGFEAARERPQEESHAEAVRDIAENLGIPEEEVERGLAAIDAQPSVTRELLMRRIAEAYRTAEGSNADDAIHRYP